jgi:hypothetical protein
MKEFFFNSTGFQTQPLIHCQESTLPLELCPQAHQGLLAEVVWYCILSSRVDFFWRGRGSGRVLEFELRILHLLSRCSTTQTIPTSTFASVVSWIGSCFLYLGWLGPWSSYLCFLSSWDNRHTPLGPAFYWLRWGPMNFLPGFGLKLWSPYLRLLSS